MENTKKKYGESSITYMEDNVNQKITVFDDLKQIDYYSQNFSEVYKGKEIDDFYWQIINSKNLYSKLFILGFNLREEKFKGELCYVLRRDDNDGYAEIWISENNYRLLRIIVSSSTQYKEEIYTFKENVVRDEDVDSGILETEKYNDYKRVYLEQNLTDKEIELLKYN